MDIILFLLAALLVSFAQSAVMRTYEKYRNIPAATPLSGADVASTILQRNGLNDVSVVQSPNGGTLSDFYDPKNKVVTLSPDVYQDHSIASIAVAAHECGHAIQHAQGYALIAVRNKILPFAMISGNLGWITLIIGLFIGINTNLGDMLTRLGIIMISIIALFQLVTLPVEIDASRRALRILDQEQILEPDEISGARKMLRAAAFTYIAAFLSSVLQVLRAILISRNNRRN